MPKVLIVDDAVFVRARNSKLLSEAGYEIAEASNGEEAVERYRTFAPDVVLMDITMPVMDGLSALREIRRLNSGAKVIMCSALGQQGIVLQAIKSGAVDFVVKPFAPEKLIEALKRHVNRV